MSSAQVTIENNRCSKDEGHRVAEIVEEVFQNVDTNADRAKEIKMRMDQEFEGPWQCIVGKNFATYVSHEENKFVHLKVGSHTGVQVFKSGA